MSVFGEDDGGSLGPLSGGGSGTNEEALSPFPYPSHAVPTEPMSEENAGMSFDNLGKGRGGENCGAVLSKRRGTDGFVSFVKCKPFL